MTQDDAAESDDRPKAPLSLLIHRLVENYVIRKTEDKSGLKWEQFKDKKIKGDAK